MTSNSDRRDAVIKTETCNVCKMSFVPGMTSLPGHEPDNLCSCNSRGSARGVKDKLDI